MKRLVLAALLPLALLISACAVGEPRPATDVTEVGATLNGNVYSNVEGDTEYWFRYGETTSYGDETAHGQVAISDDQAHPVSEPISGLSPGTTYHWQLCVRDSGEDPPRTICSKDQILRTIAPATATTPTYRTDTSVTLNGEVRSTVAGQAEYWFEYGEAGGGFAARSAALSSAAASLDSETPHETVEVDGSAPVPVSEPVLGLSPGTTYEYRLCVDPPGDIETTCSSEDSLTTANQGGRSGIVFTSHRDEGGGGEVYVMDSDGGDQTRLTNNAARDITPAWSPDGSQVVFASDRDEGGDNFEIYVMDADGGNQTRLTNTAVPEIDPEWSPDGTKIAFASQPESGVQNDIYVMNADGSNPVNLTDDAANDGYLGWSPDGGRLVWERAVSLGGLDIYTMNADGTEQTRLTSNQGSRTPAWSHSGEQIAFSSEGGAPGTDLYVMDTDGGNRTELADVGIYDVFPDWSPDDQKVAFSAQLNGDNEIYVVGADGSNPVNLSNNPGVDDDPAWSPRPEPASESKAATYVSDIGATLNASVYSDEIPAEFFWRYGETASYGSETPPRSVAIAGGQAQPVSQPISGLSPATEYHFQLCVRAQEEDPPQVVCTADRAFTTRPTGGRSGIAFSSNRDGDLEVFVMDADGSDELPLTSDPAPDRQPAWSPDATRIAFTSERDGADDIWAMDTDGSNQTRLTDDPGVDNDPAWSPDGTKIAFASSRNGSIDIWVMDANGSNQTALTSDTDPDILPAWSPDGTRIALSSPGADNNYDIWIMNADGTNPTNVTNTPESEIGAAWSPDGTRIAFTAVGDGDNLDIWVMDTDGSNRTRLTIDPEADAKPTWSPDGTKLAWTFGGNVMVMDSDGSNPIPLTSSSADDISPAWSPRP